jgi:hypothetical protein
MRDMRDDTRMTWRDDDRDFDQGYGSSQGTYNQGGTGYGQGSYGQGSYGPGGFGRNQNLGYGHDYQGTYGQGSQGYQAAYGQGTSGFGQGTYGPGYQGNYGQGGYQGGYGQGGYGRRWGNRGYGSANQGNWRGNDWRGSDWRGADWRSGEPANMGQADQSTSYSGLTNDWDQGRFAGRGPKGYRRSDERIREDVSDRLTDDTWLDASNIEVRVESGMVTLTGNVGSRDDKRRAEDIAMSCSGVKDVINQIHVDQGIFDQMSDALSGGQRRQDKATTTSSNRS